MYVCEFVFMSFYSLINTNLMTFAVLLSHWTFSFAHYPIKERKKFLYGKDRISAKIFSQKWILVIHLYGISKGQCNTTCSLIIWKYEALKFWCLIQSCNENITQIGPIILTVIVMKMGKEINLMILQLTILFENFRIYFLSVFQRKP